MTRKKGENELTINETKAEIVRGIFEMYVKQGMSLTGIARQLNM